MALKNGTFIISDNETFIREVTSSLKKAGVSAQPRSCTFSEEMKIRKEPPPALVFLDLKDSLPSLIPFTEILCAWAGAQAIVGVGQPTDATLLMKLVKIGVKEFVDYPLTETELKALLSRVTEHNIPIEVPRVKRGKVVAIYSPKGGTGVTLLSVNLAVALSRRANDTVAVCDMCPHSGDVATYLNLTPRYTIRDVIDNNDFFDLSYLEGVMLQHSSGVKVLASPNGDQQPPTADNLNAIKSVLELLREEYDFVLLDCGSLRNSALLQMLLGESDSILLMGNADVVSLRGLIAFYNKLKTCHYDAEKIKVLINRYNSKFQIDAKEFERLTKHPISFFLPNNYSLCIEAVNSGQPLNEKSDLAKKILEIAETVRTLRAPETFSKGGAEEGAGKKSELKARILRCFW